MQSSKERNQDLTEIVSTMEPAMIFLTEGAEEIVKTGVAACDRNPGAH